MLRVILVRHGETIWNAQDRYQGTTDVPLSTRGRDQSRAVAERLASEPVAVIYSSDLSRAWETAQTISSQGGAAIHIDKRLREICFGRWEGLTYDQIQHEYPELLAAWEADPLVARPPEGESLAQVTTRVRHFLDDLLVRHDERTVVLVAHGGVFHVLLCTALGVAPKARWQFRLHPASISEFYIDHKSAVVTLLNDQHHLFSASDGTMSPSALL